MKLILVQRELGGICLAWKSGPTISLRCFSKNHIDVLVLDDNCIDELHFISFYSASVAFERSSTWNLFRQLGQI